jgi:predicted PurR-regulated permease PerM/methanogenic corrinoid protein MtbC1
MNRDPSSDRSPAPDRPSSPERSPRISFLTLALVTAALYFGREVLIPLALAILISFILTPSVQRLQRMHLGRVPAVLLVVVVVFGAVGAVGWMMGSQIVDFAETLPRYEQNIRTKASALRGGRSSPLNRAQRTVEHLQEELGISPPAAASTPAARLTGRTRPAAAASAAPAAPVPVTVVEAPETPLTILRETLFPLLGPLGTAGLVVVFVIFMLIQREDLRDRLLRLFGQGRLNASTQALDEAAQRVSRYLVMQSVINGGMGTAVGIGLFFIGVPNALLWGLFAAILRFVPYVGSMIAAALPVLISLAVFPGWQQPLLAFVLFLVVELLTGNVIEPLVYGSETGISTIGILVAAVFWTWLWGPVGLLMSMPLTVCLVVIGRYVPQLQFLDVLLGDQPPLPIEAQVYHRLLAMDSAQVRLLMESCVGERTVAELYDRVLIPALVLAERDRHRGELSPEREEFIETTIRDWIEELAGRTSEDGSLGMETADGENAAERLVCVPAHDMADELAGHMFAQLAVRGGKPAVLEADLPRAEVLRRLAELGAEQVFISALEPFAYTQAREVCRDLRAHFPGMRIVVALWDLRSEAERHRRRLAAAGADEVVATLQEAVLAIRLTPTRAVHPAVLAADLSQAFRDFDLAHAESLLAEAERLLPVADLAVEVLQPALEGLRDDLAAGSLTAEQERVAGDLVRHRIVALGEAAPQLHGYRALAASAPEEEEEIGLLILALLLQRAGWSVVHLGQRAADEGFDDVIAAVQPHAILFSATLRTSADRLLRLSEDLHREHPELLVIFDGPGFRPSAVARLGASALRVGDDAREALAAISLRMPPLPAPEPATAAEVSDAEGDSDERRREVADPDGADPETSGLYGPSTGTAPRPAP